MKPANYGPVYALGLYPKLAEVFRSHGYALAIHGSLANDFDLIAVPWIDAASDPQVVADECNTKFAAKFSKADPDPRPHGRIAYKLNLSFGDCALDVSFTPRAVLETKASLLDLVFKYCTVMLWSDKDLPTTSFHDYPIEHNPAANKDSRDMILAHLEAALATAPQAPVAKLCSKCNKTVTVGCNYCACPFPLPIEPAAPQAQAEQWECRRCVNVFMQPWRTHCINCGIDRASATKATAHE